MGNITTGVCGGYFLLFTASVLQPALWRLGVMGSVCQMAQQAGRPAARGALEETRVAGRRGVAVTSKSVLRSAGVLGYVTVILS